MKRLSR
jgi:uncharacterized Fe-S radical SAM superfamily protein PflX